MLCYNTDSAIINLKYYSVLSYLFLSSFSHTDRPCLTKKAVQSDLFHTKMQLILSAYDSIFSVELYQTNFFQFSGQTIYHQKLQNFVDHQMTFFLT